MTEFDDTEKPAISSNGMLPEVKITEAWVSVEERLPTETALKSFGNEMNVIGEIIVNRYDNRVFPTHVTTNLTTIQFKEMYGERALDRVKEKYNQVFFEGKSLR